MDVLALNYDLLPKVDRQKIRAEMIAQMELTYAHDCPEWTKAQRASAAIKVADLALSRELAKKENHGN